MPCPGQQNLIKNGKFVKSELGFQLTEPRKCCRPTTNGSAGRLAGVRTPWAGQRKRHTRLAGSCGMFDFLSVSAPPCWKEISSIRHIPERFSHRVQVQG
jgi:hypothetical protein